MPYYPHPGAVLDLVGDWVPGWARQNPQFAHACAYFARVPAEFVASDFGLELHLQEERIDIGLSHPLTFGRHELLLCNLDQLQRNLGAAADWERIMAIARRTVALPNTSRVLVEAISLCVDSAGLPTLDCPSLFYFSLPRRLDRSLTPSPVCCPNILTLLHALVEQPCREDVELLWELDRARRPSHRLAHVGVSFRTTPARLRYYVSGTVREHLELLACLTSADWELVSIMREMARTFPDRRATLLVEVREGLVERLHMEFFPRKDHPGALSLLDLACESVSFLRSVQDDRAATVRRLAEFGMQRVLSPGRRPVSIKVSHIKATEYAGCCCRWKLYIVMRQGASSDGTAAQH